MLCVTCKSPDTEVSDTRDVDNGHVIRRKRKCKTCGSTFTTFEFPAGRADPDSEVKVIKRDKSLQPFGFEKLYNSLKNKTFDKRGFSEEQILKISSEITAEIMHLKKEKVDSQEIGAIVLRKLRKVDEVAYIRFMVYFSRDFHNTTELKAVLDAGPQVKKQKKPRGKEPAERSTSAEP